MSTARAWSRSVDPTEEVWSIEEAKLHNRALMDVSDEDATFYTFLRAAREAYEAYTNRTALTSTWVLTQDGFDPCAIALPMGAPLQSVSSVKYYDTDGVQQTLSTSYYRVDTASAPARVVLQPTYSWPDVYTERGQAVEITYVAGAVKGELMPEMARLGILMTIGHWWEHRASVEVAVGLSAIEVPMSTKWLWDPLVLWAA